MWTRAIPRCSNNFLSLGRRPIRLNSSFAAIPQAQLNHVTSAPGSGFLEKVRGEAKLERLAPNIQYLFGKKSNNALYEGKAKESSSLEALDITDKTELILRSNHPVRYIIEREMKKLAKDDRTHPNYYEWLVLFGRSLQMGQNAVPADIYEKSLFNIGNAVGCGVFSSEIHSTIINIPGHLEPPIRDQFHMGNKYTVLVGDFFAIKCIHFTEKAKNSKVFLKMSESVEEFASAPFASTLNHPQILYPFLPCPNANLEEWGKYNIRFLGYLSGGFQAILGLAGGDAETMVRLQQDFLPNFIQMLKIHREIEEMGEEYNGIDEMTSPFLFVSLPAVLHFQKYPESLRRITSRIENNFNCDLNEYLIDLREEIKSNGAIQDSRILLEEFGERAKDSFKGIALGNPFYALAFTELIDLMCKSDQQSQTQVQPLYAQKSSL